MDDEFSPDSVLLRCRNGGFKAVGREKAKPNQGIGDLTCKIISPREPKRLSALSSRIKGSTKGFVQKLSALRHFTSSPTFSLPATLLMTLQWCGVHGSARPAFSEAARGQPTEIRCFRAESIREHSRCWSKLVCERCAS